MLAGKAALVTGGSCGIDRRIGGAPDPDGAAVVLSFVCNRTAAEQVAAAVETTERPSADDEHGEARAVAVGGRNSLAGMSVDLLVHENCDRRCGL